MISQTLLNFESHIFSKREVGRYDNIALNQQYLQPIKLTAWFASLCLSLKSVVDVPCYYILLERVIRLEVVGFSPCVTLKILTDFFLTWCSTHFPSCAFSTCTWFVLEI